MSLSRYQKVARFAGSALIALSGREAVSAVADDFFDAAYPAFDPTTLALTGWWRADYAGSPWAGRTSRGTSLANGDLSEAFTAPTIGAAAKGWDSAQFTATHLGDKLTSTYELDAFLGTTAAWSVSGVVAADSAQAHNIFGAYLDDAIVTQDINGLFYITMSTSGICAGLYDSVIFNEIVVACPLDGLPHTFHAWYDGTNLNLKVDSTTGTPVACGTLAFIVGYGALKLGTNYDNSAFFDGRIWELVVSDTDLGSTARTDLEAYFQDRYFVSSTGVLAGTATVTFGQTGTLTARGTLAGTSALTFAQSATLAGKGALAGLCTLVFGQSGNLTAAASGAISGTTSLTFGQAGTLTGRAACVGTATLVFGQSATLAGRGALAGSTPLAFGQSGTLTGRGALVGSSALVFGQSGTLAAFGTLSGLAGLTFDATGTLTVAGIIVPVPVVTQDGVVTLLSARGAPVVALSPQSGAVSLLTARGSRVVVLDQQSGEIVLLAVTKGTVS